MARVLTATALSTKSEEMVSAKRKKAEEPVLGAFYRYNGKDLRLCVTKDLTTSMLKEPELILVDPGSGKAVASDSFLRNGIHSGTYQLAPDIVIVTDVKEDT